MKIDSSGRIEYLSSIFCNTCAADAQATKIYAQAYSKDPEFFQFWRTMEAYKSGTLKDAKVVLGADSEFLKYLAGPSGK